MYPPHLLGPENQTMPSALIPYCTYQSQILGKVPGYDYLGCGGFQPVVFHGRLCYSLKQRMRGETAKGKKSGLLLMIDPGQILKNSDDEERTSFHIYIHTLSSFSGFKAGSYALSSLKQMTGTSGFLNLPDNQKRCQVEVREDCLRLKLSHELQKQCGCIPWAISNNYKEKVNFLSQTVLPSGELLQPCSTAVH